MGTPSPRPPLLDQGGARILNRSFKQRWGAYDTFLCCPIFSALRQALFSSLRAHVQIVKKAAPHQPTSGFDVWEQNSLLRKQKRAGGGTRSKNTPVHPSPQPENASKYIYNK